MSQSIYRNEVSDQVRQFIVDNFLFGQIDAMPQEHASLLETGVIDSTGVLELITFIEEHFGISVEDPELTPENLDSLHRLTVFVSRKLSTEEA